MRRAPNIFLDFQPNPARDCDLKIASPLSMQSKLMTKHELRAIWSSPDATRMDRDASACLVLGGETLGVDICADAGDHQRVIAIIGREEISPERNSGQFRC